MLFQSKIDRAQKWLHDRSDSGRRERELQEKGELPSGADLRAEAQEEIELEKGDVLSMLLAALITILPVALLVLLIMVSVLLLVIFI